MPIGQKHGMPAFTILDKPQTSRYLVKWTEGTTLKSKTRSYGDKKPKEEAYKEMQDVRYELVMQWLEKNRGLKTTSTQWELQEE